jgi:hypothetical protein
VAIENNADIRKHVTRSLVTCCNARQTSGHKSKTDFDYKAGCTQGKLEANANSAFVRLKAGHVANFPARRNENVLE